MKVYVSTYHANIHYDEHMIYITVIVLSYVKRTTTSVLTVFKVTTTEIIARYDCRSCHTHISHTHTIRLTHPYA